MAEREGRLRAEYSEWYPTLDPATWYPAGWLSRTVLEQLNAGEPRWHPEQRVPSDTHFTFRGGDQSSRGTARTRRTDPPQTLPGA